MDWAKTGRALGSFVGNALQVAMDTRQTIRTTVTSRTSTSPPGTTGYDGQQYSTNANVRELPPPYTASSTPYSPPPPPSSNQYHAHHSNHSTLFPAPPQTQARMPPPRPPPPQKHQQHTHHVRHASTDSDDEPLLEALRAPHPMRVFAILLGLASFVFKAMGVASMQTPKRSASERSNSNNCCIWGCGEVCVSSMRWNLLCPVVLTLHVAFRLVIGLFVGLAFGIVALLSRIAHMPVIFAIYVKSITLFSPRFGPFMKFVLLIAFLAVYPVSFAIVFLGAIVSSMFMFSMYPADEAASIIGLACKLTFVDTVGYQINALKAFEDPGPYHEIKILHAIFAIIYMALGAVLLGVGYFVISLIETPKNIYNGVKGIWADAFTGILPKAQNGANNGGCCCDDPLCNCCAESCVQLATLVMLPFRLLATAVSVVFFILLDVFCLLGGIFYGAAVGASSVYKDLSEAGTFKALRSELTSFSTSSHFMYIEVTQT